MRHLLAARAARARGFTLVELLVVVAIIALLVSLLMPSLARAKELARMSVCASNLSAVGRGWQMYWLQNNYRTPNMFNPGPPNTPPPRGVPDCFSQFNFVVFCPNEATIDGRSEGNVWAQTYVNAGVLYKSKFLASERAYVCPTVEANNAKPWFNADNPWPPNPKANGGRGLFTQMTYGTRRMVNYDDPLAAFEDYASRPDMRTVGCMMWYVGVEKIPRASTFSFMADQFRTPKQALMSHVPGVNVLYLDGHVKYWTDATGKVLYDNGITGWDYEFNWMHDDIWMIIDDYHQPPVGQGKK